MGKRYQWLGYWGLDQAQEFAKTLQILFPHIQNNYQLQILNNNENISGTIAYFGSRGDKPVKNQAKTEFHPEAIA